MPEEQPKKRVNFSESWREARNIIWSKRRRLALGLLLLFVNRLMGMVLPASTKLLIDEVIGKHRSELLIWIAAAAGAATAVQAVTSFSLSMLLGVAAQRSINDLRLRVQSHVGKLPTRYFDSTKTGILISRIMDDAEGIRNMVGTGFVQLVGGLFTAGFALCILFYLNWRLTTFSILIFAIFGAVMTIGFRRLRPVFRERGKINAEVTGRLAEFLGGIRVVKAYTAEKREELIFAKGANRMFRNIASSMTGISAISAISTFLFGCAAVMMMVVGGREALAGRMTVGDIFMYTFFMGLIIAPMIQISSIGTQITEALAGLDRIREVLGEPTEEDEHDQQLEPGLETKKKIRGEIAFEDVTFEYKPGAPVLKNISFHSPGGTTTALVGSSGSGKSTLISLVMAFNLPLSGRIIVDGRDLAHWRLRDYRSHLGVVLQDNFLFDGTVAENIRYGQPGAKFEDILAAARVAHVDEFVDKFENKYETIIGERGVRLSGGQRQRIAIARAILADPSILILDEATSSLDSESEELIQDGLRTLQRGRTTFVIAHRLSTIQSANQILVLEHGEIVERGTHSELLAIAGRYKTLHDKQYKLALNLFINPGEDFTPEPEALVAAGPVAGRSSNL